MASPRTTDDVSLVDKIIDVHRRFTEAGIRHGFGGALALAYYTDDPRTTADIDVNVALDPVDAELALRTLPGEVDWDQATLDRIVDEEQVRLWWGRTPLDLFFRASEFHDGVGDRVKWHPFGPTTLPFIAANDLAVFKALFNRPKDWVDIAEMMAAGSVDAATVAATLHSLIGADIRVDRLLDLVPPGR